MGGSDDSKKVMGPLPTLFAGAGPGAEKTLAELAHLAADLTAPIQGPFGLALADSQGERLFACEWPQAADLRFPEPALFRERSEFIGPDEEKFAASLSCLVRRLHAIEPGVDPVPGSRVHMTAYVVTDLSDAAAVTWALRLMRVLRQVDTAVDTTVLALTGRTAATEAGGDGKWFETWKQVLEQLQEGILAQRVYVLDGCDTDKTWFERPEQLHHLGAEFLFYHGLTCRGLLRQNERARTGVGESLLNVCGSFGCRTIAVDLSTAAERVAERLAHEDLSDLYLRTVPSTWLDSLQEQARALVERIATICERAYQAKMASPGAPRAGPDVHQSANAEVTEAVRRTIKLVCAREPLVSLCLFLQLLRPKLARLLTQQRLWERARTRCLVAETLRRQVENTYEPMRAWLARSATEWVDRFTPALPEISPVAVSRPATVPRYLVGWVVLIVGLADVAAGVLVHSRFLVAAGGLVSLLGSVLMTLPTGWTWHRRHRLQVRPSGTAAPGCRSQRTTPEDGGPAGLGSPSQGARDIPFISYRKGPDPNLCQVCVALIIAGLIGVVVPLWPDTWTVATCVQALTLAVMAGLGLACVTAGPRDTCPDQVSDQEAPGHVNPPLWRYWAAGVLLAGLAWILLCLGTPAPAARTHLVWLVHLIGLGLVAVGTGLVLFPRTGATQLVDRVTRIPQPLAGGIGRTLPEGQLPDGVTALAAWLNGLALEPPGTERQTSDGGAACDVGRRTSHETSGATEPRTTKDRAVSDDTALLDFLMADWESQLTQRFRQAIELRSGKTLKTLALQPALWAECITHQLQSPQDRRGELTVLFALRAVSAWIESHTLEELLSGLNIDLTRFGGLVRRLAAAHWPAPRVDPDTSTNVLAIGKSLWDVVAPLSKTRPVPLIVPLDWGSQEDKIVVLRAVQGLSQGWRGFSGMPGQPAADGPAPQTTMAMRR